MISCTMVVALAIAGDFPQFLPMQVAMPEFKPYSFFPNSPCLRHLSEFFESLESYPSKHTTSHFLRKVFMSLHTVFACRTEGFHEQLKCFAEFSHYFIKVLAQAWTLIESACNFLISGW